MKHYFEFEVITNSSAYSFILPHHYRLNDRMWWFATGWIRCRNQMLSGNDGNPNQEFFIGLINVHDKTLNRMENFVKENDINISRDQIKLLHDDLVAHYLKNQNILIGDEPK